MPHILLTALAVLCVMLPSGVAASGTITYKNCTDRALCVSGCTTATVPMDQCITLSQASEWITCVPTVRVCGDLSYFTDAACTNLMFTDGFLCDVCNTDNEGHYSEAVCSRGTDGVEFLALNACGANSSCAGCNNYQNVSAGSCIPVNTGSPEWRSTIGRSAFGRSVAGELRGTMYAKYTGAVTCTAVRLEQWTGNAHCASTPTRVPVVPEGSCMNGMSLSCNWL